MRNDEMLTSRAQHPGWLEDRAMQSVIYPNDYKFYIKAHYAGSVSRCVYHGEDESNAVAAMKRYCSNAKVSFVEFYAGGRRRYSYERRTNKLVKH